MTDRDVRREASDPTTTTRSRMAWTDERLERRAAVRKALERHAKRLARKAEALEGDLDEARRAPEWRRYGEALLAYAHLVPARAARATIPDPADADNTLSVELDPAVGAPANAARYFKRAAKADRGLREIPQRLASVRDEVKRLKQSIAAALADQEQAIAAAGEAEANARAEQSHLQLERILAALTDSTRQALRAPEPLSRRQLGANDAKSGVAEPTTPRPEPRRRKDEVPAKFVPWRFRSLEGWDILIGRSSEANDHLTLHMARPEDYWFHAHGCPGSHVVLRRGKGANEPSKATLLEVASWAAFHSKARTAGKVPVIYTQKKYVRKPRGAKAGTVYVEREKMLMVRPVEPPKEQMADAQPQQD